MGVYIPNMKMPEHCGECRFAVDGWCYAYGKPNIDALANDGRTNFCPLVTVPQHGRLIDADALAEHKFVCVPHVTVNGEEAGTAYRLGWNTAIEAIMENAETVIGGE